MPTAVSQYCLVTNEKNNVCVAESFPVLTGHQGPTATYEITVSCLVLLPLQPR